MTNLDELERQLRTDMQVAVADIRADDYLVGRLVADAQRRHATPRQRHWIAPLLAAAAVIAVAVVTIAVAGSPGGNRHTPAPPGNSGPTSNSTSLPSPSVNDHVLGPFGLGKLRLGMTRSQALASGELSSITPLNPGGCSLIHLAHSTVSPDSGDGYLSPRYGIVLIVMPASTNAKTPEGIGVGSTISQVKLAYPSISYSQGARQNAGPRVSVPGNPDAYYALPAGANDRVNRISIGLTKQDCFG